MKIFKKCNFCKKRLWTKYDTFQLYTAEGLHVVYLCKPQCWENEYVEEVEDESREVEDDD